MKNFKSLGLILTMIALLAACTPAATPQSASTLQVTVSIPPQAWLVNRLGGEWVSVQAMMTPADDPHTYEPQPAQMAAMAESDLYMTIGVEFEEAWLPRFTNANSRMRVVDSAAGIDRLPLPEFYETSEVTEPDHEDEHGGADPHIWLSPERMKQVAANMAAALAEADPEHAADYQANLEALLAEIDQTDAEVSAVLAGISRDHFMIVHPALGYFADEYGLTMLALEAGGQEPGPEQMAILLDLARQYQVTALFVQTRTDTRQAHAIAEQLGLELVSIDPMPENWPEGMMAIAEALAGALK